MRPVVLISFLLLSFIAFSQSPAQFNFQGIARNSAGRVIVAKPVSLRFTLRIGTASGHISYREQRSTLTDSNGVFNAVIGSSGATNTVGLLDTVFYTTGPKFLQVEMDTANGSAFVDLGATQLLSVPYAMFSNNSFNAGYANSSGYAASSGSYFFEAVFLNGANLSGPGRIKFARTNYNNLNPLTGNTVYDSTTGVFTAPTMGIYQFDVSVQSNAIINAPNLNQIFLAKNGVKMRLFSMARYNDGSGGSNSDGIWFYQLTCSFFLNANDAITIESVSDDGGPVNSQSTFSGHKIY